MADPSEHEGRGNLGNAATVIVSRGDGAGATDTIEAPTLDDAVRRSGHAPPPDAQRGSSIGRYVVLGRLGAGGMGEVFAAYDPELDRKVAIKVLRRELSSDTSTAGRSRLLREAQAMARLSHPNVIAVHDVGTVDDQVFIAMEFIEGETLGTWLARTRPPWPRIVEVFVTAGRGLEAAHAVGLVHRDFKPDNVLIGRDGRVRVGDFGLARAQGGGAVAGFVATAIPIANVVTMTGGILGTPAYMSPEQFSGGDVDVRSDIFSFCTALYEALYGRRPFTGETLPELMAAVLSDVPAAPPRGQVPSMVGAICLRGLARDPARRYPSMQALLAELGVDPRRRRRRLIGAALGCTLLAAGGAGIVTYQHALEARCEATGGALAGVWDEPRKAAIRARFTALDRPYLRDASARVDDLGDQYAAAWTTAADAACRAHVITGERDESSYMLEKTCLDHQLERFAELARLLTEADVDAAARAIDALLALRPPSQCADIEAIRPVYASLDDPAAAAAIADVRRDLDQASTLSLTGRLEPALARATAAAERAGATGFSPLIADAELLRGELATALRRPEAQEALHRGLQAAIAAGHPRVAASAALGLATHLTEIEQRYDEARRWIGLAGAWLGDHGDAGVRVDLLIKEARVARWQNRRTEATELLDRAATIAAELGEASPKAIEVLGEQAQIGAERYEHEGTRARGEALIERLTGIYGPEHPSIADALGALALAALQRDEFAEADALNQRAIELRRRNLGERHQLVAENLMTQGMIENARGRDADALRVFEQARAILVESLGERHSLIATADNHLGNALRTLQRLDESAAMYARSIALRREHGEHNLYPPIINLAMIHYERGWEHICDGEREAATAAFQEAVRLGREALQLAGRSIELDHPHVGTIHTSLGLALSSAGDHDEALIEHQAGLTILEHKFGPTSTQLAFPLMGIGRALRHLGRASEALPPLERALALPSLGGDAGLPHELAFELAQALWDANLDRARALELARSSRDFYRAREAVTGGDCGASARWLETHRLP